MLCNITDNVLPALYARHDANARQEAKEAQEREDFIYEIASNNEKEVDALMDCFLGVGDPEPLLEALQMWAKAKGNPDPEAIGLLIINHFDTACDSVIAWRND